MPTWPPHLVDHDHCHAPLLCHFSQLLCHGQHEAAALSSIREILAEVEGGAVQHHQGHLCVSGVSRNRQQGQRSLSVARCSCY